MLTGVAFVPQAPALVPAVGRGLDAELGPVREACRTAIRRVAPAGTRVVVIGGADTVAMYGPTSRGSFAGFGVALEVPLGSDAPGPVDVPPSLAVGAWLVRDALGPDSGATGLAVAGGPVDIPGSPAPTAYVVLGDGSAARSEKAPGYLRGGAGEADARLADALRDGDAAALDLQLEDPGLLVAGLEVWRSMSGALGGGVWNAELLYDDAPFGVGYFVAAWTR